VRTRLLLALVLGAALLTSGCVQLSSGNAPTVDPSQIRHELDALPVGTAQSMAGYSREKFPHWLEQGDGCNTREYVLKRDGTDVRTDPNCHVTSGRWLSEYDNKQAVDPDKLDIDHMVPLANAWRSGANYWTDQKRSEFANDTTRPQLKAVSASVNRAKGDQDPSQWKPPYRGYWCQYATDWITVKRYWELRVTKAEKTALSEMLDTCATPSPATSSER
jgi:Protein of unknown function (DUF1524)